MANNLYKRGAFLRIALGLINEVPVAVSVQKNMQHAIEQKPCWVPMRLWVKYSHWGQMYAAFADSGKMCEILAPVDAEEVAKIAEWYK